MVFTATLVGTACIAALYILYELALPKPLPGIPYNAGADKTIWGDVPSLIHEMSGRADFCVWIREQHLKTRSPISQVFLNPGKNPTVLIADHRESRDIMMNRTKDFDRGSNSQVILDPVAGNYQLTLKTGPEWRLHRRLLQDTMTPVFLQTVAAPSIHTSCLRFINLWKKKTAFADGRPFSARDDICNVTLDSVLAFAMGSDFPHSAIRLQQRLLDSISAYDLPSERSKDVPVNFTRAWLDVEIEALIGLLDYLEIMQTQPLPWLWWQYYKNPKTFKNLKRQKDITIRTEIERAIENQLDHADADNQLYIRNAVDHIINRETKLAEREKRKPNYFSSVIIDEIYGFIAAGHDTTATSMMWTLKLLTDNQATQSCLRKSLQSAFPIARSEGRFLSTHEITSASIPYLEAFPGDFTV